MATFPLEFVNDRTLFYFRLPLSENLRHLNNEMVYLHTILNDENHISFLQVITSPWALTYTKPKLPYTATMAYIINPHHAHQYQRHSETLEYQRSRPTNNRNMEYF